MRAAVGGFINRLVPALLLCSFGALLGCGYSFVAPGAYLPDELESVFVAEIDERSTDPELSQSLL